MSIFNKPVPERPPTRLDPAPAEAGPSVIASGMKVTGDVETNGVVKVEGTVEGSIRGARQLLLGRTGAVHGDIQAQEVVIAGRIVGTVTATERVEVQSTSNIEGDIHTRTIVVLEGGVINGSVRMGDMIGVTSGIAAAPEKPEKSEKGEKSTSRPELVVNQ
jgi:cytoskeletal protein CcmA (bactofilin family)